MASDAKQSSIFPRSNVDYQPESPSTRGQSPPHSTSTNAKTMKSPLLLVPFLAIALGAMSCAATKLGGQDGATIFANDDPQRFPGENRLQFGVHEASALLGDAYLELREAAARRDLDWCVVLPAATIEGVWAIDQEVRDENYDKSEKVKTDFSPAFEQSFFQELTARATKDQADVERWKLQPEELVAAVCKDSGIEYPYGLFLPDGQESLRESLKKDDDLFEYMLAANLTGSRINSETVAFTVECELIPLLDDSDPISAKRTMEVHIPIDNVYYSTGKAEGWLRRAKGVAKVLEEFSSL